MLEVGLLVMKKCFDGDIYIYIYIREESLVSISTFLFVVELPGSRVRSMCSLISSSNL